VTNTSDFQRQQLQQQVVLFPDKGGSQTALPPLQNNLDCLCAAFEDDEFLE
jgi:hypothetical protein